MMSKYAGERHYDDDYSPDSLPRGRRYILDNLNEKVLKYPKGNVSFNKREKNNNYTDLKDIPSSQQSIASSRSNKSGPVGSSNKVMPTEPIVFKGRGSPRKGSPRKTPRQDPKDDLKESDKKKDKGLSPRDEYMVTKLYDKQIIYLKPADIRYTHDQIPAHFNDGRSMLSTFVGLLYKKIEIKFGGRDVPPIEVMQTEERHQKLWFVVNGNRRLYIFKRLQKCGAITDMQVVARKYDSLEMDKHFLTRTQGRTISVVNDATLNSKIATEVRQWKEWKTKQPTDNKKTGGKGKRANNKTAPNKSKYTCADPEGDRGSGSPTP